MPLPALLLIERKFEQQKRILELRTDALGREIERHIQRFESHRKRFEQKFEQKIETQKKKIEIQFRRFEQRNGDEVRFLRTWIEKPLSTGAVAPSGKVLARTMASYIDPSVPGPVIELGPG